MLGVFRTTTLNLVAGIGAWRERFKLSQNRLDKRIRALGTRKKSLEPMLGTKGSGRGMFFTKRIPWSD